MTYLSMNLSCQFGCQRKDLTHFSTNRARMFTSQGKVFVIYCYCGLEKADQADANCCFCGDRLYKAIQDSVVAGKILVTG